MGTGILICGLNGTGKSTLGKVLAQKLHFYFIDSEGLSFPKTDSNYIYASPRTRKEVGKLLLSEIKTHINFVFATVKGGYDEAIYPFLQYAVLIEVPKDLRIQRIINRSFQKFGSRILLGGDLHEQEKHFLNFVTSRAENTVEDWVHCLNCPVIKIDGTKPIEENINYIMKQMVF